LHQSRNTDGSRTPRPALGGHLHRLRRFGRHPRLKVAVGKAPYKRRNRSNDGQLHHQTRITFTLAEFICQRLDVDMIEVGL
jgi:hypothetical protein